MNKKIKSLSLLLLMGLVIILAGCSEKETVYQSGGAEEVKINNNQIEHKTNITSLSYLIEKHSIKKETDEKYVTDPSDGLNWEYTVHKDDPAYDELMEEFDYLVNTRGFDLKEKDSTLIASGKVNEDMLDEFGTTFDEYYNTLELTDTGLILNGVKFTEVE